MEIQTRAALLATASLFVAGCDGGEGTPGEAGDASTLWAVFAAENEVDRGVIAYATFRHEDADGPSLPLADGDRVTCNGRPLDHAVEAWSGITHYRSVMSDLGEGGRYTFVLTRADGQTYEASIELPSTVLIDEEASDGEVQLGRDAHVTLSAGDADEAEVSLVAECLSPVVVTLDGAAEAATVPGDRIECACIAGGLVPPCDGVIRAQRINRGELPEGFAGGETLGVQRDEAGIHVIE